MEYLKQIYDFFVIAPDASLAIAPLILGALIGAGAGGLKHFLVDKPRESRQKKLASEYTRLSPWLSREVMATAPKVEEANLIGSLLSGGVLGGSLGKSYGPEIAELFGSGAAGAAGGAASGAAGGAAGRGIASVTGLQKTPWLGVEIPDFSEYASDLLRKYPGLQKTPWLGVGNSRGY